jgi:hypothetical protein
MHFGLMRAMRVRGNAEGASGLESGKTSKRCSRSWSQWKSLEGMASSTRLRSVSGVAD